MKTTLRVVTLSLLALIVLACEEPPMGPSGHWPMWMEDIGPTQSWVRGSAITAFTVPAVDHGHPPPTYSASGLPTGLQFNPSMRLISGTPTTAGTGTIVVAATNRYGTNTWAMAWTVTVPTDPEPPTTTGKVGVLRTCPFPRVASAPDTFGIDLVFAGHMDQWLKDEIECAAAYWENTITADTGPPQQIASAQLGCQGLSAHFAGRTVDDMRIAVHFRSQTPSATAWACEERPDTGLPFYGRIAFSRSNPLYGIPRQAVNPPPNVYWSRTIIEEHLDNFFDLARHEIAHVLGFSGSTAFEALTRKLQPSERLAPSPSSGTGLPVPDRSDVRVFTGPRATAGYWAKTWLDGVAIEDLPGVPVVGDHWSVWLWGEVMYKAIVLSSRSSIGLSTLGSVATRVSLGAFEDMGYEIDYTMADSPCDSRHPIMDPGWEAEHCKP